MLDYVQVLYFIGYHYSQRVAMMYRKCGIVLNNFLQKKIDQYVPKVKNFQT